MSRVDVLALLLFVVWPVAVICVGMVVAYRIGWSAGHEDGVTEGRRRQIADSRARRDASFGWATDDGVLGWADLDGVEQVAS